MISYRERVELSEATPQEFANITGEIESVVRNSGVTNGIAVVRARQLLLTNHSPADMSKRLKLKPLTLDDTRLGLLAGQEVVAAVTNGKLDFGPFQRLCLGGESGSAQLSQVVVEVFGCQG